MPPGPRPTSPNVTTSPGRQRGSIKRCAGKPVRQPVLTFEQAVRPKVVWRNAKEYRGLQEG